jgi:hypothetical protein
MTDVSLSPRSRPDPLASCCRSEDRHPKFETRVLVMAQPGAPATEALELRTDSGPANTPPGGETGLPSVSSPTDRSADR